MLCLGYGHAAAVKSMLLQPWFCTQCTASMLYAQQLALTNILCLAYVVIVCNAAAAAASAACCCQVKLLVEEGGATATLMDRWEQTPLDEARRVGASPVVEYLAAHVPGEQALAPGCTCGVLGLVVRGRQHPCAFVDENFTCANSCTSACCVTLLQSLLLQKQWSSSICGRRRQCSLPPAGAGWPLCSSCWTGAAQWMCATMTNAPGSCWQQQMGMR
jgi:hypothetical protein